MTEPITESRLRAIIKEEIKPTYDIAMHNKKYLFGNGEIGMDERIRNLEKSVGLLVKLAWAVAVPVAGFYSVRIAEELIRIFS